MNKFKAFLCFIGIHEWHNHEIYVERVGEWDKIPTYDRICLRCDHEQLLASKLHAKSVKDLARRKASEEKLKARAKIAKDKLRIKNLLNG